MPERNLPRLPVIAVVTVVLISGCASRQPTLIPAEGPDALTVYQRHVAGMPANGALDRQSLEVGFDAQPPDRQAQVTATVPQNYADTIGDSLAQLNREFPEVPNYQLVGWVIGHVNQSGSPIPTYPTKFWLYQEHHYAQPGEARP